MGPVAVLAAAIRIYILIVIARVIFSWLPPQQRANEFYRFLFRITEPVLLPVRRLLPGAGGLDFSPFLVIVLLEVIRAALLR
jgi:YggT family protein